MNIDPNVSEQVRTLLDDYEAEARAHRRQAEADYVARRGESGSKEGDEEPAESQDQ